jgi:hypothetical protein
MRSSVVVASVQGILSIRVDEDLDTVQFTERASGASIGKRIARPRRWRERSLG